MPCQDTQVGPRCYKKQETSKTGLETIQQNRKLDCPYNTVTRLLKYYNTKVYHSTESTQSLSGVLDPEALAPYHPKSEIPHGFFAGEKMIRTGVG